MFNKDNLPFENGYLVGLEDDDEVQEYLQRKDYLINMKELKIELKQIENILLAKTLQVDENEKDLVIRIENCGKNGLIPYFLNDTVYQSYTHKTANDCEKFRQNFENFIEIHNAKIREDNEEDKYMFTIGDTYWLIDTNGEIVLSRWDGDNADIFRYNSRNTFKTRAEAKRKLECLSFIYENMHEFTIEEWRNIDIGKYSICADIDDGLLEFECSISWKEARYHFKDRETTQKVIGFIGFDDWVKYF